MPVRFAARAATAAPTIFRTLVLDIFRPGPPPGSVTYELVGHKTERLGRRERAAPAGDRKRFTDAGWVRLNNPCQRIMDEELDTPGAGRIILVSVGTADTVRDTSEHLKGVLKGVAQQATDTEQVHGAMVSRSIREPERFSYFRFNLRGGLRVALDEWLPRPSGHVTRRTIREAFETWRSQEESRAQIAECAKLLVHRRKQRVEADRQRWNRYASGR